MSKASLSIIKRWDIIIILFLVFVSFFPHIIFTYSQAGKITEGSLNVAVITVNNEEIDRIILTGNEEYYTINYIEINCDLNTVEVNNEKIRIRKSTCLEQICINRGFISKPGQTIVCLPHKVIIEIEAINEAFTGDELIINSY